jgi:hypothetical protein
MCATNTGPQDNGGPIYGDVCVFSIRSGCCVDSCALMLGYLTLSFDLNKDFISVPDIQLEYFLYYNILQGSAGANNYPLKVRRCTLLVLQNEIPSPLLHLLCACMYVQGGKANNW